ncbi:hypothetical protein [Solimonas fluminis]|uniref:hypothetical protein n=1 Tax=Solimonas fluminis TaxID=2086571 RepID=UPI0013FE131E|nr:hypothetical protein [Solimonas fluminis]
MPNTQSLSVGYLYAKSNPHQISTPGVLALQRDLGLGAATMNSQSRTPINLTELRNQFSGKRFCELIQHHLARQNQRERVAGLQGTIAILPEAVRGLSEGFIDRWNGRVYNQDFWQQDTADVFDEIIADARRLLGPLGFATDDEAAFNLFNIVVLNYAYSAHDQPKMREFMTISGRNFPWPSMAGLLYPISATIYMATATPAGPAEIAGYGIANLGYLLVAAGAFVGTFRILGLRNRWKVFGAAFAALALGTVLSNLGG